MSHSVKRMQKRFALILLSFLMMFAASCSSKAKQAQEMIATANQYLLDGNYEEAIASFNQAIEIDPKQPGAYHGLYSVYTAMSDYVNARTSVERGIEATGADVANSEISYRDDTDGLEGVDLLIHDYQVITKIMTNPSRVVTKEGDRTYQADYEYEFDDHGRITLLRVITEDGTQETRYTYNLAGVIKTMDREGIENYELSKSGDGYKATYVAYSEDGETRSNVEIKYDSNGRQVSRTVSGEDPVTGEETTVTSRYSYDSDGNLTESTTSNSAVTASGKTTYEKGYPTKVDHGTMVMTADGQQFDTEEYSNEFDEYDRIKQIKITCHNSETSDSFLWQTTDYYYYDTIGE